MKGNLIIISSPSGGGKGTLIREVLKTTADITFSVSYTTRAMREGEMEGREYHFVDRATFEAMISAGDFLEHAEVHGNLYGTSKSQVEKVMATGTDVLLEIDVQGAATLIGKAGLDAVSIFILPPSFETLRTRLTLRATESSGDLLIRLRNAFDEVLRYELFRYIVINDDLTKAVDDLRTIIRAERLARTRQNDEIQAILSGFDASKHQFENL
ncbi:MAG: guanylate kinase [Acidobacteria bacterium]|nr:guanylate kinase [Acidobacteriota bacterium]MCW5949037.1 guanylate kinase [Pyrinomonadaceae bacterium]